MLDLDRDDAWRAVTDAEELEHWLADEVEIDLVEGGDLHVRFDDGRERHGTVEEVTAPERRRLPLAPGARGRPRDGRSRSSSSRPSRARA